MGLARLPHPTVFHPLLCRRSFLDFVPGECRGCGAHIPSDKVAADIDLRPWDFGRAANSESALSATRQLALLSAALPALSAGVPGPTKWVRARRARIPESRAAPRI